MSIVTIPLDVFGSLCCAPALHEKRFRRIGGQGCVITLDAPIRQVDVEQLSITRIAGIIDIDIARRVLRIDGTLAVRGVAVGEIEIPRVDERRQKKRRAAGWANDLLGVVIAMHLRRIHDGIRQRGLRERRRGRSRDQHSDAELGSSLNQSKRV